MIRDEYSHTRLQRELARARAEANAAHFWRGILRVILGGIVAVMSGAAIGTTIWFLTAQDQAVPTFSEPLVTAGGESHQEQTSSLDSLELAAESPSVPPAAPMPAGPESVPESMSETAPEAMSTGEAAPYEMEEPLLSEDQIGELIAREEIWPGEPQAGEAEPADTIPDSPFSKRTAEEIDTGLASLDLVSFAPANIAPGSPPAWQRYAVPVAAPADDEPVIALVIDDLGLNRPNTERTIGLPGPLTLAFLTYSDHLDSFVPEARAAGHELLVHVPMAPRDPRYDPGPNVLDMRAGHDVLAQRLSWALSRFDGYVGINNHMGSRFTTSIPGMAHVMMELKARGLLYLDSLTVPATVGAALAQRLGVPFAKRDVFIDNDPDDPVSIRRQLTRLERVALRTGRAIGIAHPHTTTLNELAAWLPEVQKRGFRLVPISAVVRQVNGVATTPLVENTPG